MQLWNKILYICMFSAFTLIANAQDTYQIQEYQIKFFIKNAGITVEGSLEGLEAEVLFHSRKPDKNTMIATLDPATIKTGISIRDKHLKRSDYFDVEHYPKIALRSLSFSKDEKGLLKGTFELSIKEHKREVLIPVYYVYAKGLLQLESTFMINRLDYGLGDESLILSDDVEIHVQAKLVPVEI